MILRPISVVLNAPLEKYDTYLPLSQADTNRLLTHIPDGDETYLTIQDNLRTEYIHVENQCGTIVIIERGVDSEAYKFPKGSCVFFETSLPVIKWLICNYNCCEDGDCDCLAVEETRATLPSGRVGQPWAGRVVFDGSDPINFKLTLPESGWMEASVEHKRIIFSGTPTAAGTFQIIISAANCAGEVLVTYTHSIVIDE